MHQTVTLDLPDEVYDQLRREAERANRTVDAYLSEGLSSGLLRPYLQGVAAALRGNGSVLQMKGARADGLREALERVVDAYLPAAADQANLPPDLAAAITPIPLLTDEDLWKVARSHLSRRAAARLTALNHKNQREDLSPAELDEQRALVHDYERAMLVRAAAAAELKRRGHDISELGPAAHSQSLTE